MFKSCEENVCCSTANWRQRIGKIKERKEEEEKTSINKIVTLKWHINYTYRWKRLIVNGECQMSNAYVNVNVCWLLENYHWFHTDKCTTIDVYSHVIPYQLQCIWRNAKKIALWMTKNLNNISLMNAQCSCECVYLFSTFDKQNMVWNTGIATEWRGKPTKS